MWYHMKADIFLFPTKFISHRLTNPIKRYGRFCVMTAKSNFCHSSIFLAFQYSLSCVPVLFPFCFVVTVLLGESKHESGYVLVKS